MGASDVEEDEILTLIEVILVDVLDITGFIETVSVHYSTIVEIEVFKE